MSKSKAERKPKIVEFGRDVTGGKCWRVQWGEENVWFWGKTEYCAEAVYIGKVNGPCSRVRGNKVVVYPDTLE